MKRITSLLGSSLLATSPRTPANGCCGRPKPDLPVRQGLRVNPDIQQTITFEHADKWKYGDNFLFVDKIFYNGKPTRAKAPPTTASSARACRSARSSTNLEFGPVKDVLLAMTYERRRRHEAYLIGPGFDLNIPGFNYFTLNFYRRHTEGSRPGDGVWQITPVGPTPFPWAAPTC
jgi:nucleoside-specific outer membrane channel protein Tsx